MSSVARALARIEQDCANSEKGRRRCPRIYVDPVRDSCAQIKDVDLGLLAQNTSGIRAVVRQHRRADEVLSDQFEESSSESTRVILPPRRQRPQDKFLSPVAPQSTFQPSRDSLSMAHIVAKRNSAACVIQSLWRGSLTRWFQVDIRVLGLAATVIQRKWRRSSLQRSRKAHLFASEAEILNDVHSQQGDIGAWSVGIDSPALPKEQPPPGASLDVDAWSSWVAKMKSVRH